MLPFHSPAHETRRHRLARTAFLVSAATLAGCAQVARQGGFADVQGLVAASGVHEPIEWRDDPAQEESVRATVGRLVDRELTPETAVQIALLNNPSLQATYEELGIAQASVVQAGLLENPVFSGAVLFGGVSPTYDLDVAQGFLDALLIPARERVAGAEFERVKAEVGGAVFDLAAEVRAAFYALQGAEQIVAVLARSLEAAEASRDLAAKLREAGNVSDLQLATERALAEEVRTELLRARAETVEPREHLRELLGLSTSTAEWKIVSSLPGLPGRDPSLGELLETASAKRLELAAARAQQQVFAETLETTRFWRYLGLVDVGVANHKEQGEKNWVSGPSLELEIPLFDQRQAEIAGIEAQLRQSERKTESAQIAVAAEVRRAYGRLEAARRLAENHRDALIPARRRVVELSQEFYDFMLLGAFELLAAKREEIASWADYVDAVRDYWVASAELERAVGARIPLLAEARPMPLPLEANTASPAAGAGEHAGRHSHGGH
ncbi:MAG: TolC family protein [Deltaproteobacteria bacterium]|nr:TolC family protein [Deltaproteobacteria bacterium]